MSTADQQPGPGGAGGDFGSDDESRGLFDEAGDGFGLIEDLYPGAVLVDGGGGGRLSRSGRAVRNNETAFLVVCVLLAFCAVGAVVGGAFGTIWAGRDASRSAAFYAAPACAASAATAVTAATAAHGGDCVGWTSRSVTGVDVTRRAGTTVYLSGGQQIHFGGGDAWVDGLTVGTTVAVLEWDGNGEALRQPDGVAVYSPSSAPLAIYQDLPLAVSMFSFAVGLGGALLGLSPLRVGRARLVTVVAVLLGLLGPSGFVAGLTMNGATSFRAGIIAGVVVYLVVTGAVFAGIAIFRNRRRQRRRGERLCVRLRE